MQLLCSQQKGVGYTSVFTAGVGIRLVSTLITFALFGEVMVATRIASDKFAQGLETWRQEFLKGTKVKVEEQEKEIYG